MAFQVFIALILMTSALGFYFAPRNRHVGLRTKNTLASEQIWRKTNRLAGVLFAFSGAGLLYYAGKGPTNENFYFATTLAILAIAVFTSRCASALAKNSDTAKIDTPAKKAKGGNKNRETANLFFSQSRKISVFFSLLCLVLIGLAYLWTMQCVSFMPNELGIYDQGGEQHLLGFGAKEYSLAVRLLFFGVLVACAVIYLIVANFKAKREPLEYSLKASLSGIFFAYAASFSLLISTANYAFYRSVSSALISIDELFSMILPLAGIVIVWAALFKISSRLAKSK